MSDTIDSQIHQAISLANSGNKAEAKKLLAEVVQKEPSNARAWYLLSQVVEQSEQAIYCLQQVQKSQPGNAQAIERLEELGVKVQPAIQDLIAAPAQPITAKKISGVPPVDNPKVYPRAKKKHYSNYLLALLFGIAGIAGVYIIASRLLSSSPATIDSPPTSESPGLGENGQLDNGNPSNPRVVVGSYPEVLDEIVQAKLVNDTMGLQEIYDRGGFFFVPKGTPVLVIDESYISAFTVIKVYKVRILAGDYTGQAGWVDADWVVK